MKNIQVIADLIEVKELMIKKIDESIIILSEEKERLIELVGKLKQDIK